MGAIFANSLDPGQAGALNISLKHTFEKTLKHLQRSTAEPHDPTRERLLHSAAAIFADMGYHAATTRMICVRARANAAAVNYHFGDKLGLYTAVLKDVVTAKQASLPIPEATGGEAEAALRKYIHAMLENLSTRDSADLYPRLMAHELSQPTPGLAYLVAKIVRPRTQMLCELIARLTGRSATSRETQLSAQTIIGQILHYVHARAVLKMLWPTWPQNAAARRTIASHLTEFSLAALRGVQPERGRGRKTARPTGAKVRRGG